MAVSAHLHRRLEQVLGAKAAEDLNSFLDDMDGLRGDVRELRNDVKMLGANVNAMRETMQATVETMRANMETMRATMEALLEKGLREQTRFFFLAWAVLLAAIVGLYAR